MRETIEFEANDVAPQPGRLAYIKPMGLVEARALGVVPDDAVLPDDLKLFAIHAADGSTIAITDTWASAYGAAVQNDLVPMSLH